MRAGGEQHGEEELRRAGRGQDLEPSRGAPRQPHCQRRGRLRRTVRTGSSSPSGGRSCTRSPGPWCTWSLRCDTRCMPRGAATCTRGRTWLRQTTTDAGRGRRRRPGGGEKRGRRQRFEGSGRCKTRWLLLQRVGGGNEDGRSVVAEDHRRHKSLAGKPKTSPEFEATGIAI